MVSDMNGKELLDKQVEILFEEDDGTKNFFQGTIKKVEFSSKSKPKPNTVVTRYFVVFEDGDKKWFNFDELEKRKEIKWPSPQDKKADSSDNGTADKRKRSADESETSAPEAKKIKAPVKEEVKTDTKDVAADTSESEKKEDSKESDAVTTEKDETSVPEAEKIKASPQEEVKTDTTKDAPANATESEKKEDSKESDAATTEKEEKDKPKPVTEDSK